MKKIIILLIIAFSFSQNIHAQSTQESPISFFKNFIKDAKRGRALKYFQNSDIKVGLIGSPKFTNLSRYINTTEFLNFKFIINKDNYKYKGKYCYVFPYEETTKTSCWFKLDKNVNNDFKLITFSSSPESTFLNEENKKEIIELFKDTNDFTDLKNKTNNIKAIDNSENNIKEDNLKTKSSYINEIKVLEGKLSKKNAELESKIKENSKYEEIIKNFKAGVFTIKGANCDSATAILNIKNSEINTLLSENISLKNNISELEKELKRIRVDLCEDSDKKLAASLPLNTVFNRIKILKKSFNEIEKNKGDLLLLENEWKLFNDTLWNTISQNRMCLSCEQAVIYASLLKEDKGNIRQKIYEETDNDDIKELKITSELLTIIKLAVERGNDECKDKVREIIKVFHSYIKVRKSPTETRQILTAIKNEFDLGNYTKSFILLSENIGAVNSLDSKDQSEYYYYLGHILLWNLDDLEQKQYLLEDSEKKKLFSDRVKNGISYLSKSIDIGEEKCKEMKVKFEDSDYKFSKLAKSSLLKYH